jgi:hypothetical protein
MTTARIYPAHQQRVVDEQQELVTKIIALRAFIESNTIFAGLCTDEQTRLRKQESIMTEYILVLTERIDNF